MSLKWDDGNVVNLKSARERWRGLDNDERGLMIALAAYGGAVPLCALCALGLGIWGRLR